MAGVLTLNVTKNHAASTAALTGGPATTAVVFVINQPGGGITTINATTDGTGAATVPFVPASPGTVGGSVIQPNASTTVATAAATKVSG